MKSRCYLAITLLFIGLTGCSQKDMINSPLITEVVDLVAERHISPKALNDELSLQIFETFLQKIDVDKLFITLDEVERLQSAAQSLDDELRRGSLAFLPEAIAILFAGIERAEGYVDDYLQSEIELFTDERLETSGKKRQYVNKQALKQRWGLTVKQKYLEELYLKEVVESHLSFAEQRTIALQQTKSFYRDYFYELKSKSEDDLIEDYVNAYLSCNDYQSSFLSPESRAEWDVQFNRNFVGVGISIETTIDYPKIQEVFFDGPAWKTQKIQEGDILMKISNKENQWVDVAGLPLQKVTDLLKGEKGSKVVLRTKNPQKDIKDIEVERGQIFLSKTISFIINDKETAAKIGYISLPRFYSADGGCAQHVLNELAKLSAQNVEGVLLDLRNNQGGSAWEAREIIGYFLSGNKTMQMVSRDDHRTYQDEDPAVQYAGKLIVMVNERSSSASELLSGNLQDYNRAIIVGSQTFGKGTVQRFVEIIDDESSKKLGDVKLTIAKFYTGNGRSSQYHGIVPDIILPSENRYLETGERARKNALVFEDLASETSNSTPDFEQSIRELDKLSKARQAKSAYFLQVEKRAILKEAAATHSTISLNYQEFKRKKTNIDGQQLGSPTAEKIIINTIATSKFEGEKAKYWKSKLQKDPCLYESTAIMLDYLKRDG